jgi:putative ABC transport system permease protein
MPPLSDSSLPRAPRLWRGLLRALATEADRAYLLDDLEEGFRLRVGRKGLRAARRWYRRQTLLTLLPLSKRRLVAAGAAFPGALRALGGQTMTDLIHSLRLLRKNLGTTSAAVLSLVIGITLSATVFSVVDWIWLSSSPFSEPGQIVRVFAADPEGALDAFGYSDYEVIRDQTSTMEALAAVEFRGGLLTGEDGTTRMLLAEVTSRDYFDVLGLQPFAGIAYHADDDPGTAAEPGVVVSHSLWEREFGGDREVIGSLIQITGRSYTLLGVAPRGYTGIRRMAPADVWFPVESWWGPTAPEGRRGGAFHPLGRINPGTEMEQIRAEVNTIMNRLDIRDEATQVLSEAVVMTDADYQTQNYGGAGALLLGLVTAVLIIACANAAGLQLARTLVRQQEMAIRVAIGGRRGRLIRQLLVEGLVVSGIALVLSLGLTNVVLDALPSILPPQPTFMEWGFGLDGRVAAFTVLLALISAVTFSLAPALRASRPDMVDVLKGNDLSVGQSGRPVRGLSVLVVAQLALSLVLVSTTALLLRSFLNTQSADLGIERNDVLVSWIIPTMDRGRLPIFYSNLVEQVEALPGVRRATMARTVPFFPSGGGAALGVHTTDAPRSTLPPGAAVKFNLVGPDYFDMLGIDVLRGRPINDGDRADGQSVAVVNETLANRIWDGEDPVGRTVRFRDPEADPVLVVGVVEDGKYNALEETQEPYLYLPFSQMPWGEVMVLAQTEGDPTQLAPAVRNVVRSLSPDTYMLPQSTLEGLLRDATYNRQLMALALGVLAVLGLVLAAVGLYGVSAHAVNRRSKEIGIRMALGANGGRILRLVLDQGGRLILFGTGLGIPGAVAIGLVLRSSLFGVSPVDPLSLIGAAAILGLVTLSAVLLPSRRAASVEPLTVIRHE